ncbi:DUF4012 domain-containing protein [Candidatus Berkelbacteria bacterium]|nr:DUF4012 domain-containing protein [Candidatus Berkelbacteria bacterium]
MRRLDGIWGPRHTPSEIRVRRFTRLEHRFTNGFSSFQNGVKNFPWKNSFTLGINGFEIVAVLLITTALMFGLIHPAVSQSIDAVRLIKPGRYLIAFLNSAELRPSGGFLGSFAIAEYDGKNVNLEVETNIYKKDNQFLTDHFIPLPKPLDEVWTGRSMSLVNANAAADFNESAKLMASYYEAEYGEHLDGVIGLTVLPVIDLIHLLGNVDLPQHNIVLTAENFLPTLHQKIQIDYFKASNNRVINEPKTILADLVSLMPDRIKKLPARTIWQLVDRSLKEKNLLLYFTDHSRQQIVEANNWAGRLEPTASDALAIYHGNYGGAKTSLEIAEELKLERLPENRRRLSITRTHPGGYDEFTEGENRNYTQVFLPAGTRLIGAERAGRSILNEVDAQEGQSTVLGFWFTTQPNSSQVVTLEYDLPEGLGEGLRVQRQPGTRPSKFVLIDDNRIVFSGELRYDLTLP